MGAKQKNDDLKEKMMKNHARNLTIVFSLIFLLIGIGIANVVTGDNYFLWFSAVFVLLMLRIGIIMDQDRKQVREMQNDSISQQLHDQHSTDWERFNRIMFKILFPFFLPVPALALMGISEPLYSALTLALLLGISVIYFLASQIYLRRTLSAGN